MKPILTVEMQAGRPVVLWKKQGMDGVEIWVDRSDGKGFVFLATDTQPDYIDTAPLPAARSALWKYKAIYLQAGERVGQWSDVVSIALAGWFFSQLNFPPNPCKSSPLNQSKK
ncbi:MAG: hypothetical protein JWM68_2210 [Verrucomicrobiales bacterium]|nr:hypothetical protein [Verrucomicrobiales bacterium]